MDRILREGTGSVSCNSVFVLHLMCNTMLCSRIDETIEVQWLTPHEEVEKYDHGVCQYRAYQAVLIMP